MLGTLENQDKSHWKDFVKPLVHAYNCTRSEVTGFTPYELMFGRQPRLPVDLAFGLPVKEGQQKSHSQYVKHHKIPPRGELQNSYKECCKVKPETGEGPWRTLHRDLLRPCGFLQVTPEEQPKPLARRKTRQNIRSDPSEVDQSSDEDDIIPIIWSQEEPVPEVTRYIVLRDVPIHHGPRHSEEDLTTKPNKVTDDVPANANILPGITPVNRVTLDLNLPGNEPVEREMNLLDNGNSRKVRRRTILNNLQSSPTYQNVMRHLSLKRKVKRRLRSWRNKQILMT
ncbi:hypothetical protein DPEC_G00062670 [Dallia pectoralis]|uniref:Uncharacterized protein n=1 Tax=Dallia pectoralis TaxID=75939 RepID=A0ACC2H861_DALPE|nr:hypothetical protein DPEC_G00062670 [Dallia pectoralis]